MFSPGQGTGGHSNRQPRAIKHKRKNVTQSSDERMESATEVPHR